MPIRNMLAVCLTILAVFSALLCPTPLLENCFAAPMSMAYSSHHPNKGKGPGPGPNITTTSLPSGAVGVSYSATMTASGGKTPYTWSVVQGQLPPGLTLDATSGNIAGVPTQAAQFTFTVGVTDARGKTAMATLTISISGSQSTVAANPTSLSFGNVNVGSSSAQNVTVSVSGTTNVTFSQVSVSGTDFSVTSPSLPLTLGPGQTMTLGVTFAPATTGSVLGSISIVSDATNSTLTVALSGTGVEPQISVVPSSIAFGNVVVGNTNTQTVTVSNSGNADLTLSQANLSGSAFSLTGLTLPATVAPGQNASFNVAFTPGSASSFTGSLSLVSNAPTSPTVVSLSGTGVTATLTLSANPTSLSFGNVTVGQTSTKSVTVSNSGNASVSISQVNVSGTGFSASGLTPPVTLDPGQSATISVVFAPTASGSVTGSLSVVSNATNSPTTIALSGSGVTTTSHSVALSWTASTSTVAGYNVYRSSQSGGPYTKLNSSLISGTSYTDTTVQAGQTYYYVTTAVESNNVESAYSNEVSAVVPSP